MNGNVKTIDDAIGGNTDALEARMKAFEDRLNSGNKKQDMQQKPQIGDEIDLSLI